MQVVKLLKNHLAQVRRIIQMDDTASSQLTFDSIPVARGLFQHFFFLHIPFKMNIQSNCIFHENEYIFTAINRSKGI